MFFMFFSREYWFSFGFSYVFFTFAKPASQPAQPDSQPTSLPRQPASPSSQPGPARQPSQSGSHDIPETMNYWFHWYITMVYSFFIGIFWFYWYSSMVWTFFYWKCRFSICFLYFFVEIQCVVYVSIFFLRSYIRKTDRRFFYENTKNENRI